MIKMNKFNEKLNSKLTKTKLFKRGVALALAATTVGSLAGCGKKAPLEDTILENSVVALVDGNYEILKATKPSKCFDLSQHTMQDNYVATAQDHDHYINVVTNEYLTTKEECDLIRYEKFIVWDDYTPTYVENLEIEGSISNYLTKEELQKANDNELTDEDVVTIVARIKALPVEDTKENQKSK